MYIEHLRTEFYDVLLRSRPLLIAAADVDSVCAVKILQTLFALDGISYTLVAADGYADIKEHFLEFKDKVKSVVLINCGGTIDILGHLDNPKDVTIFIVDSHRPTHILNIYDDTQQVKIVIPPGENEDIPGFDDVFQYDEDENEESDPEDVASEDADEFESRQLKKKEKERWREKRKRILFEYSQYSYFGPPASIIMLEVAWTMNRGEHELVWYGIVGLTDYYTLNKMDRQHYVILASQLQKHVSRLIHSRQSQRDSVKIFQEKEEVSLLLYRHWTLMDSLAATPYFAVKLKFWAGEHQINRFLLDVGLPQTECRQKFGSMDLQVRKNFKDLLVAKASKWNLEDVTLPSFTRQMGVKRKIGALDSHMAALSTLECYNGRSLSDRFKAALDTLPSDRFEDLDKGIEAAKTVLRTIMTQVQQFIETSAVKNLGPFLLAIVHDAQVGTVSFSNPNTLSLLSRFTLMAVVESSGGRRRGLLPLITIVESSDDVHIIMGIPPLAADNQSNLFGKAFERVSETLPETVWMDSFEAHIVLIHPGSKKAFLDKLLEIME